MIQNLDPASERFLTDLQRIQTTEQRAQQRITSGLRVSSASDAPDQIGEILGIRSDMARMTQTLDNLSRVQTETDSAEKGLQNAVQLIDRARTLAIQAAGTLPSTTGRQTVAVEIRGILEQLVGISRTEVDGRFIFGGDADISAPYQVNLANPNGVDRLTNARGTRQIQDANSLAFPVAKTAGEIFDKRNPDDTLSVDNIFAAVNGLRVALETDDQPGIDAAAKSLRRVGDYLNLQLGFYGTVQNRVTAAVDEGKKRQVQLQAQLSQRQDADITQEILLMTQSRTNQEAAMSSQAQLPRTTLFDYLR